MKNKLPKGWKTETLGGIAKYINGAAFKPTDWSNSGSPIVRIQNLNGKNSYNYYNGKIADKYIIKNNDILISWSASLDVYRWNNGKALLNQHIFNTEIDEKKVRDDFFFYLIKFALDDIKSQVHGVGMQHITKSKFEKIEVPVPPLQEQQKIVKVLDATLEKIDQAIELVNQNIEKLEQLNLSILEEMFKSLEKEKTIKLEKLDKITAGGTPFRKNLEFWNNGTIDWYKSGELNSKYISSAKEKISEVGLSSSNAKLFPVGTLLIGMYDTAALKMSILKKPSSCNQAIAGIKPNKDYFNTEFVYYQLKHLRPEVLRLRQGVRQQNLSSTKIKAIEITFPNLQKQKQIVKYLDHTTEKNNQLIQHYKSKLKSLQELKKSVLDSAFKGKLRRENTKPKKEFNLAFYQMQLIGLSIQANKQNNIVQGEMAVAKDIYLLDRLYDVNTKMKFVNHSWGPFAPEIKKRVTNKQYFGRKNFPNSQATYLDNINEELLLEKVDINIKQQIFKAIQDLNTKLFLKVTKYRIAEVKELLATVLKCIEDVQNTELSTIRQAMQNWKIKQGKHKTKAEKFTEPDTEKILQFITKEKWHLKVLS